MITNMVILHDITRIETTSPHQVGGDGPEIMWLHLADEDANTVQLNIERPVGETILGALRHELEKEPKDSRSAVSVTLPEAGMDVYYSSNRKGEETTRYFLAGVEITRAIEAARKVDASVDVYLKAEEAGWAEFDAEREAE